MPPRDAQTKGVDRAQRSSLWGAFEVTVSPGGRVTVPAVWRPAFAPGVFISPGFEEGSLLLLPMDTWGEICDKLSSSDCADQSAVLLQRFFGAGGQVMLDAQGRITIPATLRKRAGIERRAIMLGAFNRLELWTPTARKAYEERYFVSDEIMQAANRRML